MSTFPKNVPFHRSAISETKPACRLNPGSEPEGPTSGIVSRRRPKYMPSTKSESPLRRQLRSLVNHMADPVFQEALIQSYIDDTAFLRSDVIKRELFTPTSLIDLLLQKEEPQGAPLGKVAVLVPKNSLGLTMAKAIASSHLLGNETIVRMPRQLTRTTPLYESLLTEHLPGVSFAPVGQSGEDFLTNCFNDPTINAVVIYGDDAWIDAYRPLGERSGTKLLFEGPGNDALIVMPDADIDAAVSAAIRGGLNNGGQSCSAFERFFVHASVHDAFAARLVERVSQLKVGSPEDEASEIGPIASKAVLRRIVTQLRDAVAQGATLRYGGEVVSGYYRDLPTLTPAVLTGCRSEMAVVADETFGPVFPVLSFTSVSDLMPALDATRYGLNAAVYGACPADLERYLEDQHRNVYYNHTPVDREIIATRLVDGGYRRSGFVWEQRGDSYVTREGRRFLTDELSQRDAK